MSPSLPPIVLGASLLPVALACSASQPTPITYSFTTSDGSVAEVRFNGVTVGRTPLELTLEDLSRHLRPTEGGEVNLANTAGSGDAVFVSNSGNLDGGPNTIESLRTTGDGAFRLSVSAPSGKETISGELLLRVVSTEDGQPLQLAIDVPAQADLSTPLRMLAETKRTWKFRRRAASR